MDPVDDFRQATRMRFDLQLHYRLDALSRTQEEKDRSTSGICLHKPAGKLEFTLNTQYLNIAALKSHFDILFVGTKSAPNRIRWSAQLPTGPVPIKTSVADATITKLSGTFESVHQAIAPPVSDTSCSGEAQGLVVTFETPDDKGGLSADADAGFATATIDVSRLQVKGQVGDPQNFSVKIQQHPHSECVSAAVEGQPVALFALVSGVPTTASVTYQWAIQGNASAIGPSTSSAFKAMMPSPPENIDVSVDVTVAFANSQVTLSDSKTVIVISNAIASSMARFCKLFMQAPINHFVRPLWDPLRDLVTRPMSLSNAQSLQAFSRQLSNLSTGLVAMQRRSSASSRSARKAPARRSPKK